MSPGDASAVEIRAAEPADAAALLAAIAQIDRETAFLAAPGERPAWSDQPDAGLARLRDSGDGIYLIARQGGAIVGYVGAFAGQYRSTRGVLSIHHIGVRAAVRGRGIGGRLLAALEAWARARGAHRIDLTADLENAAARALYRAHGFSEEGEIREAAREAGRWRSFVVLAKLLDDDGATRPLPAVAAPRRTHAESLTIRFRPVVEADAPALCDWERALLSAPPRALKQPDEVSAPDDYRAPLAAALASPLQLLVAATVDAPDGARIIGLLAVAAQPVARLQPDVSLLVNVLADYRRLGIGRRLQAIGEDWARGRGAHRLSTSLHAANPEGLAFAAALGFTHEITMRRYARLDGCHVDLLGFAKRLPGPSATTP